MIIKLSRDFTPTSLTRTTDNIYHQLLPSVSFPFDIPEKSIVFNFDKFYFLMKWLTPGCWVGSKSSQRRQNSGIDPQTIFSKRVGSQIPT